MLVAVCTGQSPTTLVTGGHAARFNREHEVSFGFVSCVWTDRRSNNGGGGTSGSGYIVDPENTTAADSGSTADRGGGTFGSEN